MTSWLTTSAEEIRRQLEQLTSKGEEKLKIDDVGLGALFEHGQAVLRASAESAAEQVQQSVQRLASEADEGLQSVRGSFAASIGGWGHRAAADLQSSDLINLYASELDSFTSSFIEGDGDTQTAATAAQILSVWNQRLQSDYDSEGQRLAAPGLRGLLHTECLHTVLRTLTSGGRRRPLLGRAAAVAAEQADGSPRRRASSTAEVLESKPIDSNHVPSEAVVGEQLAHLMLRASEAPEALIAQLLTLLAEAAEAADRCGGALSEEKNPAEEDVGWVVNLVLATLAEKSEADALASQRLSEALRSALDNFSKASELCDKSSTPQHLATSKAAPFAGGGRPDIGSNVWACWPVDGHWYRAKVRGFAPRDRVRVSWCCKEEGQEGHECVPCVEISDVDAELFNELSSSSVMRVDASIRRPPAVLAQVPPENVWAQALQKVETHGRNFQELRCIGKQLDFHLDWANTVSGDADAKEEEEPSVWRYVPDDGCHIDIRSVPAIAGSRTHERLIAGEVFRVSETFEGADGTLYLKLADGRGWVFESKAGIGTLCVRCQSDSESEGHSEELSQEKPLSGAAETISAWRVEIEERAETLGSFAADCEEEVKTFEDQISSSTAAMAGELEALHRERALTARRADGLRMRREELLVQLRLVEEEIQEVESADAELNRRESQLKNSMARVSKELAEQLETSQENGLVAACRQRVLLSTIEASKSVAEQITQRAAVAANAVQGRKRLSGQQKKVTSALLESDRARYHELQEMISSWQELIWGPGSGILVANPSASVALHAAHLQAVSLVEDSQREAEEAASTNGALGFEGLWRLGSSSSKSAISRQMSRASAGYKLMREQLCENLTRLGELQCATTRKSPVSTGSTTSSRSGSGFLQAFGIGGGDSSKEPQESQDSWAAKGADDGI